jgi:ribulose-phosphate 3-epimerase
MGEEIKKMELCGADMLHIDVMDGHFVPNITIGAPVIKTLRPCSDICFDVHLMLSEPQKFIPDFINAGADIITIHSESDSDTQKTLDTIKAAGIKAGISVKPSTPVETVFDFLGTVDMVLVMTVEPGFGGQSFIDDALEKIEQLRCECIARGLSTDIEVDGGINPATAAQCAQRGANVFVSGTTIFRNPDPEQAILLLRNTAHENYMM